MSNTPQKKPESRELKQVQETLIQQARDTGKLSTEELVTALSPLGVDMNQMEETYHALNAAGIEVLPPQDDEEPLDDVAPSEEELQELQEELEDENILEETASISEDYSTGDPVRMYLREIGKVPLLSAEDSLTVIRVSENIFA